VPAPKNYLGPWERRYETFEVFGRMQKLKELQSTWTRLKRVPAREPRGMIRDVVNAIEYGYFERDHTVGWLALDFYDEDWTLDDSGQRDGIRELNDPEHEWMKLLAQPSVNADMLQAPRPDLASFVVFADRVRKMLDDPRDDSLFAKADTQVDFGTFHRELNSGLNGPVKKMFFNEQVTESFLKILANQGRIK
jgi:hypothetical protein